MRESIGHVVIREERFMQVTMRSVIDAYSRPKGLKPVHVYVLDAIAREEGRNVKQLCEEARMLPSNLSPICSLLERSGYVRRERDDADRRSSRLFLTDDGRLLLEGLGEALDRALSCAGEENERLHAEVERGFKAFRTLVERAAEGAGGLGCADRAPEQGR